MVLYCAILIVSIATSTCITWLIRNFAKRYHWAPGSISSHHIHARRIPRLGGLAVFLSFFGILAAYSILSRFLGAAPLNADVLKLLLPATCLFATGLLDDLLGLSANAKLLGQIVGGVCLYASGLRLFETSLEHFHPWAGPALSLGATVFWLVLICNAINLIDGLDGLAAGVGLFSMVSILTFSWAGGVTPITVTTLILGGSVAGFLVFNFWPASIFLGDSGSLFLGCMLSGLVMGLSKRQENAATSLLMPVFVFALPLADTTISVLRRFLSRRPLFEADRGHVHHMLLNLGLSHRKAVWTLYGVSAMCTVLSLVLLNPSPLLLISAGTVLVLLLLFSVRKLRYQEFATGSRLWRRIGLAKTPREAVIHSDRAPLRQTLVPVRADVDLTDLGEAELAPVSMLPQVQAEEAGG